MTENLRPDLVDQMTGDELAEEIQKMAHHQEFPNGRDAKVLWAVAYRLRVCSKCAQCRMQIRHEHKAELDGCKFVIRRGDVVYPCGLEEHLHPIMVDGQLHGFVAEVPRLFDQEVDGDGIADHFQP